MGQISSQINLIQESTEKMITTQDTTIAAQNAKLDAKLATQDAKLDAKLATQDAKIEEFVDFNLRGAEAQQGAINQLDIRVTIAEQAQKQAQMQKQRALGPQVRLTAVISGRPVDTTCTIFSPIIEKVPPFLQVELGGAGFPFDEVFFPQDDINTMVPKIVEGLKLSQFLMQGHVILLTGPSGSGKTRLSKALINHLYTMPGVTISEISIVGIITIALETQGNIAEIQDRIDAKRIVRSTPMNQHSSRNGLSISFLLPSQRGKITVIDPPGAEDSFTQGEVQGETKKESTKIAGDLQHIRRIVHEWVGGTRGATVRAGSGELGKLVWKALNRRTSASKPDQHVAQSRLHLVQFMRPGPACITSWFGATTWLQALKYQPPPV